jgi:hypothetical protein
MVYFQIFSFVPIVHALIVIPIEYMLAQGWHKNTIHREFKALKEETSDIYLTEVDLEKLKAVELTGVEDEIRDRFILGLRTGLRISDWSVFESQAIIKDDIATIPNKKTGKVVAFPLPSEYNEMMQKYGGRLPKQWNKEYVNREIKSRDNRRSIDEVYSRRHSYSQEV